jgi:cytochrome c-type biogenesis protein CcsB
VALLLLRMAAALYLVSTGATLAHVLRPANGNDRRLLWLVYAALTIHAVAVVLRAVQMGAFPMADVYDALSVFGLISGVIAVLVSVRGGVPPVAWLSTPLVTMLVVLAAASEPTSKVPAALSSALLSGHISLALLGDAAFVIAGVVAVVYLMQERRLRAMKRRPRRRAATPAEARPEPKKDWGASTAMSSLPALEALDDVSLILFKVGFPLMTLGILTGALYSKQILDRYWTWDARNTVSALVWLLYAAMLHARLVIGWRGRKAAILTVVGVIAILVTFVGLGLLGGGRLHGQEGLS